MRITKLRGKNIKGWTGEDDLAPVTLYAGRNFTGKTTRLNALTLALAGYLPGVGKKGSDIFARMASGNPMRVEAEFDELATRLSHQWEDVRGSVKHTEGNAAGFEMPPVAIDAAEYFGLSEPERVKLLFSRATLGKQWTREAVTAVLSANLKNVKLEVNTPESEGVIAELVRWLGEHSASSAKLSVQDWLTKLSVDVRDKKLLADQNAKRMQSTAQGLTQVAQADPPMPDAEARLAAARTKRDTVVSEVSKLETELTALRNECHRLDQVAKSAVDESAARKELDRLQVILDSVAKAMEKPPTDRVEFTNWEQAVNAANAATLRYNQTTSDIADLEAQIAHARNETSCPTCGQSTAEVKKGMILDLQAKLKKVKATLKDAKKDHDLACAKRATTADALTSAQKHVADYQQSVGEYRRVSQEHGALKDKLASTAAAAQAIEKLPSVKANGEILSDSHKAAMQKLSEATSEVSKWDVEAKRLTTHRADAASRARAEVERLRVVVEAQVFKQMVSLLGDLQAKLVEEAVAPLLASANELCGEILLSPLSYDGSEIGFTREGKFISHRSMSGTERALTYAAVSVALAAGAPLRLVMLDEFDIDDRNMEMLLARLCVLYRQGKIDQAVVAHTRSLVDPVTGVSRITDKDFKCIKL